MTKVVEWRTSADANQAPFKNNVTKINQIDQGVQDIQQALRNFVNDFPWIEYGKLDGVATFTGLSGNQLSFPGPDLRTTYQAGRQIRVYDGDADRTYFGKITASQYTNGGNNVLTCSFGSDTLPVKAGLRVWLYIVDTRYQPSTQGLGSELILDNTNGKQTKIRVDSSGLELWFEGVNIATVAPDGILVGKKSRGNRAIGLHLRINGSIQAVATSGPPLEIARELATGITKAKYLQVTQGGVVQDGGIETTGNGNLLFDPGA